MIITYYYSLLAYISLSPLIPFFYAHHLFSLIPRAISDSKLTPPISPSSAAHFANTAVADLHRHCRGPLTANREFFFLHYKALESGSLGIAIYEAVEIASSNIHGFNKFPSVADENIMPLFLEKYHPSSPTISLSKSAYEIGIFLWRRINQFISGFSLNLLVFRKTSRRLPSGSNRRPFISPRKGVFLFLHRSYAHSGYKIIKVKLP
ncbi:uncharacterized protein [Henckelia pumila]|uniref:uncharacterized protein n=1 Tax=Henckelia pumila TaxID=405737 RepID=UPI003C6DC8BB